MPAELTPDDLDKIEAGAAGDHLVRSLVAAVRALTEERDLWKNLAKTYKQNAAEDRAAAEQREGPRG